MKFYILGLFLSLCAGKAFALVDMRNANFNDQWTHINIPGTGFNLTVEVAYNSRSLYDGMFGFGWCSDYETKLEKTPEGLIKVTVCGAGNEITFAPRGVGKKQTEEFVQAILAKVKADKRQSPSAMKALEKTLINDPNLRDEYASRYNVARNFKNVKTYYAQGSTVDVINVTGSNYQRTLSNGNKQIFNAKGELEKIIDPNGNFLDYSYRNGQLIGVTDRTGKKLSFQYYNSGKVKQVTGPNRQIAKYKYKGADLVAVTVPDGLTFTYKYDDLHNLTHIYFPDKTYKKITYDKKRDWVLSFQNRKKCVEKYKHEFDKKDPQRHYWVTLVKTCGKKVTNRSRYEFWYKKRDDGRGDYLARVKTKINNKETDTTFHPEFERPIASTNGKKTVKFSYYRNGLMKTRTENRVTTFFEYNKTCKKVSQVKTGRVTSKFKYDDDCNLSYASNNAGQVVKLKYDSKGRIVRLTDQAKRLVNIKYEERFGKPSVVERPGLGAIRVSYKSDGEINKVDSKDGPSVAVQVASAFNNLLDIIRPAGVQIGI